VAIVEFGTDKDDNKITSITFDDAKEKCADVTVAFWSKSPGVLVAPPISASLTLPHPDPYIRPHP